MKFGVHGPADVDQIDRVVRAEQLGYDYFGVGDAPMLWSDYLVTLTLAAKATSKIILGTGVTVLGLRLAPAVAHGMATLNRVAPGRVFLGLGTGNTGWTVMGHDTPVKHREFAESVKVIRALLAGDEVDYTVNGVTKPIKFQMTHRGFIDVEHYVPIYLAAMGPKGQELSGELADGLYEGWPTHEVEAVRKRIQAGAQKSGRSLDGFALWAGNCPTVLDPGEELTSDRVMDDAGVQVIILLHAFYHSFGRAAGEVLPVLAPFWDEFCSLMEAWPERTRHYRTFAGHGTFIYPEERKFITPQLIQMFCTTGRPEELIEIIRGWEAAGVTHVNLYGAPDRIDEKMERFSRLVMAKL
jgi:alkanesulfonate monooxygenase SsuD/methylene tetrahydromethanopterin reductase-like flavin-dependent oxidoreductase (luciferase family)